MNLASKAFAIALTALAFSAEAALAQPAVPPDAAAERVMGSEDAQVTIIEYASLTCPHCAKFHKEVLPQIKAAYIDTGKAKLIYRDFPLDQYALKASLLARCAPADRYFAFISVLFSEQQRWSRSADPVAELSRIGLLGGVSKEAFDACVSDKALTDAVLQERITGQEEFAVDSTPTFIINGTKVLGAQSFDEFKAVIDGFLK